MQSGKPLGWPVAELMLESQRAVDERSAGLPCWATKTLPTSVARPACPTMSVLRSPNRSKVADRRGPRPTRGVVTRPSSPCRRPMSMRKPGMMVSSLFTVQRSWMKKP